MLCPAFIVPDAHEDRRRPAVSALDTTTAPAAPTMADTTLVSKAKVETDYFPSFHRFAMLPKELRDMMWDRAVRPNGPVAHFFTAMAPHNEQQKMAAAPFALHDSSGPTRLVAPRDYYGDFSWTRDNNSGYLNDFGLWGACQESRAAVRRRFDVARWKKNRARIQETPSLSRALLPNHYPSIGFFQFLGGRHAWTGELATDLVYLRPSHPGIFNYVRILADLRRLAGGDIGGLGHAAFEYDPVWDRGNPAPLSGGTPGWDLVSSTAFIAGHSGSGPVVGHLWLIDYRLCRSPLPAATAEGAETASEERYRFAGKGCTYVEVRPQDGWVGERVPCLLLRGRLVPRRPPRLGQLTPPVGVLACEWSSRIL